MPTDVGPSNPTPSASPHPLHGKTVVLLGASGALGSVLLQRLLAVGARPALAVRKGWQVDRVRAALGPHLGLVAEVGSRDSEAAAGFTKGATDALGPIEALIAACGAFAAGPVHKTASGLDLELLEANFLAVHNMVRAVVGPMIRRKSGNLVLVGSAVVHSATPEMALYRASKAALHEYADSLAVELRPHGVGVALATPTTLDTRSNREAMPEASMDGWQSCERLAERLLDACTGPLGSSPTPLRTFTGD